MQDLVKSLKIIVISRSLRQFHKTFTPKNYVKLWYFISLLSHSEDETKRTFYSNFIDFPETKT